MKNNHLRTILSRINKGILILLCSSLILSCSKEDNREDGGKHESEGYDVSVKSPDE